MTTQHSASSPAFYVACSLCYDLTCTPAIAPVLTKLQYAPLLAPVCVLSTQDGAQAPGLYVSSGETVKTWRFVIGYADLCAAIFSVGQVKIVVSPVTPTDVPTSDQLYLDGFKLPPGTGITATKNGIYCWVIGRVMDGMLKGVNGAIVPAIPGSDFVPVSVVGVANGLATLDPDGYIPKSQLPPVLQALLP